MEEKGLSAALDVLERYAQDAVNLLLDTVLLPLRLLEAFLL